MTAVGPVAVLHRISDDDEHAATKVILRDHAGISRFFSGLELADPGIAQISKWRPRSDVEAAAPAILWAGVAETGVTGNTSSPASSRAFPRPSPGQVADYRTAEPRAPARRSGTAPSGAARQSVSASQAIVAPARTWLAFSRGESCSGDSSASSEGNTM